MYKQGTNDLSQNYGFYLIIEDQGFPKHFFLFNFEIFAKKLKVHFLDFFCNPFMDLKIFSFVK